METSQLIVPELISHLAQTMSDQIGTQAEKDSIINNTKEEKDTTYKATLARFSFLEKEINESKTKLDSFLELFKVISIELSLINNYLSKQFGVDLVDKCSELYKSLHDFEDIGKYLKILASKKCKIRTRQTSKFTIVSKNSNKQIKNVKIIKRGRGRPKKINLSEPANIFETSDEDIKPSESELKTDPDDDDFFPTPQKPKRRREQNRERKKISENVKKEEGSDPLEIDNPKKKKLKAEPKSLQCEECGKILKADSSLRWHMLMHADLRPVACTEPGCGKKFRDKSKLAQHAKIHNGEKTEICRFCERGFLRKKDLVVHERTHTGEKPHSCHYPDCTRSFNIKDHLTIHLRVHTGERPYICPICSKSFSQANSLRIHKKIHLRHSGEFVPAPRKPRSPRKVKILQKLDGGDLNGENESKLIIVPAVPSQSETPSFFQPSNINLGDNSSGEGWSSYENQEAFNNISDLSLNHGNFDTGGDNERLIIDDTPMEQGSFITSEFNETTTAQTSNFH